MFGYLNMSEKERNQFIHRILPLRRLKSILEDKQLALLNPKMWEKEDPYENFLMNQEITLKGGSKMSFREITKHLYGLCYTKNTNSDYAWKVYARSCSSENIFIQIKTKPNRLLKEFEEMKGSENLTSLQIGKVSYTKWKDLKTKYESRRNVKPLEILLNMSCFEKRFEYRHEKEVRLLVKHLNHNEDILFLPFDLNKVCYTILVDPRLKIDQFLKVKKDIKNWGFKGKIYRSTLYTAPKMNLIYDELSE